LNGGELFIVVIRTLAVELFLFGLCISLHFNNFLHDLTLAWIRYRRELPEDSWDEIRALRAV
jgi:hypothetical protein